MSSQANTRQTRSKTRVQQANANPIPGDDDDQVSNRSSEDSFVPSMVDSGRGELRECAGCDRPNNAEKYMVECQKCSSWYHFSCANVNTGSVRSTSFFCPSCIRSEISIALEPAKSQLSGISSSTSVRAARLAREMQRLDEEKRIMDELSRERIERERALNERELQERMERERQFLARKHELMNRQEEEEVRSVRSMRSSQRSAQRTEDWVKTASEAIGPGSTSVNAEDTSLGNPQGVHPSSTPLMPANVDDDGNSISEALGSLTLGSIFEEPIEGAGEEDAEQPNQLVLLAVNVKPYLDLLKIDEVAPTSAISKVKRVIPTLYKRWSVETGELRQQKAKALQQGQQTATELRNMQEMVRNLQLDIDTRANREIGMQNHMKSLQIKHAEELRQIHRSETGLQNQLQHREHENACLKIQISSLNEEMERIQVQ